MSGHTERRSSHQPDSFDTKDPYITFSEDGNARWAVLSDGVHEVRARVPLHVLHMKPSEAAFFLKGIVTKLHKKLVRARKLGLNKIKE